MELASVGDKKCAMDRQTWPVINSECDMVNGLSPDEGVPQGDAL